ncbi:MAG TPA: hypothetical protein VEG60_09865 [Candidatus Binatia bacterium]|nr:hypothetical protein [Candidatus Binatia bacterium]
MKKRWLGFLATGFIMTVCLWAEAPLQAQSVDNKIKSIEEKISRLKAEQEQTKAEQMELKREATTAAAALPTFTYRTGSLAITAADKSWQFSTSMQFHVHMYNWINGRTFADDSTNQNFTTGDLFIRRNRPFFYYCWEDCLYEIGYGIDQNDGDITLNQHARFFFHLENIHPFYPTIEVAGRGGQNVAYVERSSSSSARLELTRDMLNDAAYDSEEHTAIGVGWLNTELWTGDFTFWTEYRVGPFQQNLNSDTDRKQFFVELGTRPFRQLKNKWIQRLKVGVGYIAAAIPNNQQSDWGKRLALRTDDRIGRIRTMDANNIGGGNHYAIFPGVEWGVGPYLFRSEIAYSRYDNDKAPAPQPFNGNTVKGLAWSLQNELYVWSPKGFLTGSSNTPGSILLGASFARSDMDCGSGADCTPGASTSHKGHLIKRELDVWYFLRPGLSLGTWLSWWSTPNMPTTLQERVGCVKPGQTVVGKACSWYGLNVGLRANF